MPVNFSNFAKPTFLDDFKEELEGRVIPEHVAHLDSEPTSISLVMHLFARCQFLSGGLIKMNMFSGF